MSKAENRALVEQWYTALATMDLDLFVAVHSEDCVYNISGHSPISGQVRGIRTLMDHVLPIVFGALKTDEFRFCTRQKIVCADDERVVGIMEADGPGSNGVRYDQRYVHMFGFRNGKIGQVWEFFDTALANAVLFANSDGPDSSVQGVVADAFEF